MCQMHRGNAPSAHTGHGNGRLIVGGHRRVALVQVPFQHFHAFGQSAKRRCPFVAGVPARVCAHTDQR